MPESAAVATFLLVPLKVPVGFFCFRQVAEETYEPQTCHDPGQVSVELSFCWAGYHLSLEEGRHLRVKVNRKTLVQMLPIRAWGLSDFGGRSPPFSSLCKHGSFSWFAQGPVLHVFARLLAVSNGLQV